METDNGIKMEVHVHDNGHFELAMDNGRIFHSTENSESNNRQHIVKNRTQDYADIWDANMFLNDFKKWDKNAGVNVKLSAVYLEDHLPHFVWKNNSNESAKLKELLSEYINEYHGRKMLLILGQPGIGKSTLITWITANFADRRDDILVYQFATDLKSIDWSNTNKDSSLADNIIKKLNLSYESLNGKTLIIDGFDEISVESDRADILNKIYWELKENIQLRDFSLIITCRENYIINLQQLSCDYITLQPWDEDQIRSFCTVYSNKARTEISEITIANIIKNNQVLGIPLILYMVLALKISIDEENSLVDVYDRIFALEGGIYDRCIDNESYSSPHRISQIKKQIHQISREIAFWMFENEPDKASILYKDYQKICDMVVQDIQYEREIIEQNVMIGSYFKRIRHCEGIGTEEISFVHRTIYEYFVAEMIYNSIENAMIELSDESQMEFAGNIAWFLKRRELTYTITEYLKHKILKLYSRLNNEKTHRFYQWWENTVDNMMNKGMFYYTERSIQDFSPIMNKEVQCFLNLLKVLESLHNVSEKEYILSDIDRDILERYIRYSSVEYMYKGNKIFLLEYIDFNKVNLSEAKLCLADLSETNLSETNLSETDLKGANFSNANLSKANLKGSDLRESILQGADLSKANLSGINLNGVDLRFVNLNGTDLREANLCFANLDGANLNGVNLNGANLNGANLNGTDLSETNLRRTDLSKANLRGVNLNGVDLRKTNLSGTDLSGADLSGADLSGADLRGTDLSGANLSEANLSGANLSGIDLSGADLSGADLSGADLSGVDLRETNLRRTDLSVINLSRVNLSGVNLSGVDLRETNLSTADLRGTDLRGTDLSGADLSGADLSGANLSGANLSGVNLYILKPDEAKLIEERLNRICLRIKIKNNIEDSIWREDDIQKFISQLREIKFEHIIIEDENGQKRVSKNELFPDLQ